MTKEREQLNIEQILDRLAQVSRSSEQVSIDSVLSRFGRRSFGPILTFAGLIMVIPIVGDIPGVPLIMGIFVITVSVQLLMRRDHFWLPEWLLQRSIEAGKLCGAIARLRRPARFVDRFLHARLIFFTSGKVVYPVAVFCILIGAMTPLIEVVPFSANLAGAALIAFGLALSANDGVLALLAFFFSAVTVGVVVYNLF